MENIIFSSYEITNLIKETVDAGGSFPLVVTGTSMRPFLKDGKDTVRLRQCSESDYKKGAILLFKRADDTLVLHRVNEVMPDGSLMMNGDSHTWCEKITKDMVIAVVSDIEKNTNVISCDSPVYKAVVTVWMALKPVRGYIFKIFKMFRG